MSVVVFTNAELETAFHRYIERRYDVCTILLPCVILVAWVMFGSRYLSSTQEVRALLPQGSALAVWEALLAIVLLLLQVAQPQWYIMHQKAVHLGAHLFLMATYSHTKEVMLWFRANRAGQREASHFALVQAFLAENTFFSTAWIGAISLHVGQVINLLIMVLYLLIEMRSNSRICASAAWRGGSFGGTGDRLAEAACTPFRAWVGLGAPTPQPFDPSSCSASLMFWQVLGTCLACIAVMVNDVLQRRAFLRSGTARALIPQAQRAAAESWPPSGFTGGYPDIVLWVSTCLAMALYLLQIAALYCLALA